MSTAGDQLEEMVSTIATAMLPELASLAEGGTTCIVDEMPEVADPSNLQLVRASAYSHSNALLDAMIRAMPLDQMAPSAEVIQSTRAMVQHGISHDAVMRGYRLAIAYWCARWADAVARHCVDSALAVPVVGSGTAFLWRWLDMVTERISAEYRDEAERLARDGSMARAAYVGRLLTDEADVNQASRQLGYTLAGYHVAFVVRRHPDADEAPLEATALALAQDVASSRPLIVPADPDTVWCWTQTDQVRKRPSTSAAVLVGLGRPGSGIAGFRSSHHEALRALRVARIASHAPGTTTTFDDVELVALCTADPEACHTFITETLGSLADDTEEAHRMRVTLETFFACDGNYRATGDRLFIHHNTVRYRLDRIESMLGYRPPTNRRKLDLALHLALQLNLAGTSNGA